MQLPVDTLQCADWWSVTYENDRIVVQNIKEVTRMILADKIIRLRKKNGWSQEELAGKMNVSRQAVSKWEAAQTTPDLEKILQLGNLFGVTTDYLLKDEIEDEEFTNGVEENSLRKVTLTEANDYLEQRKDASVKIAIGTFLCIISVIPLLILGAASELASFPIPENVACGIGIVAMLLFIAIAVLIFVRVGFRNAPYEFLEKEMFETEYGVIGLARDKQKSYRSTYEKYNCIGTCSCVLSPISLLCGSFMENEFLMVVLLCLTIFIAGIGVIFFVIAGVRWGSMQKLLQEGDFSEQGKRKNKISETIATVYWLVATAVYLCWSFMTNDWNKTWIVWAVAGILFAGVISLCNLLLCKDEEKQKGR